MLGSDVTNQGDLHRPPATPETLADVGTLHYAEGGRELRYCTDLLTRLTALIAPYRSDGDDLYRRQSTPSNLDPGEYAVGRAIWKRRRSCRAATTTSLRMRFVVSSDRSWSHPPEAWTTTAGFTTLRPARHWCAVADENPSEVEQVQPTNE